MRMNVLRLIGALTVLAIPLSAGAVPRLRRIAKPPPLGRATPAAYACAPGYYWEPDAYAPHGKFRPAHCASRW